MSRQFNDTSTLTGLVQGYELEIGANPGDVSGNTTKLKQFAAATKGAFDRYWQIALPASGKWQLDDSNQTDYPIITTNLVDGQRDYSFTTDESGNLVLDIYRVFVLTSATGTQYVEIFPVDQQSDTNTEGFTDGQNSEGTPYRYDKTANGIFLDPISAYDADDGLKVYINREASYFASTDTTKKPGVPGIHHDYFFLRPAMEYARRNNLAVADRLEVAVLRFEEAIKEYFGHRAKDERNRITTKPINFR
jgi:hypothetical protein